MNTLHPQAPLFANLLEPATILDDIAVAALLVLGAAPAALFLLSLALAPAPPGCSDGAGVTHQVDADSQQGQAPSLASMI